MQEQRLEQVSVEPPQVEWPPYWPRFYFFEDGNPLMKDCEFRCSYGWLPEPDGSASLCEYCLSQ